jgi:hypothetical protein
MLRQFFSNMNKFFISFAAIISSGIFAYSYLKEWIGIKVFGEKIVLEEFSEFEIPYYYHSENSYLTVMLLFGLLFAFLFSISVYFTLRQKWKLTYLSFVLTMLGILAIMVNAAIK